MSDRLEEILTKAGVPKGFHKIIGTNKLSNIDTFTEAKQALQSYIDTKIIEELEDVKPGKDTDVIHLSKIIDDRIKALNHRKEKE